MKKIFLILLLFISLLPQTGHAKVYIDIFSPSSRRFPIVVPNFKNIGSEQDKDNIASKTPKVIADDLEFSGIFKILDSSALGDYALDGVTSDKIKWDSLSIIGAEAIVTGSFRISAGTITFELRVFDAVQGKFITGKKYEGRAEDYRLIAHKFANEVFNTLTGEKGIFDSKIVYVTRSATNDKDICMADYDGNSSKQITNYHSLTLSPAWSRDGKQLAFTSYKDGNPNMYVMDIGRGNARIISKKKGVNITPDWSPDGEKIALTLNLNNGNSEIYILTEKTGGLERVTNDMATDVSPSWSPDGKMLAFVSDRAGGPQIYTVELTTGKVKRISYNDSNYNTSPAWSPRGDKIAFAGLVEGQYNIFLVSPDGQSHQQLTGREGNNEDPAWSSDGRFLAFCSSRTGQKEIYIMRADGTGQKRITFGKAEKSDPAWSPSGTN
ncbi:MAG: Tol-Pal system beta propeller repeat protein TolB [Pseudomonadota bacterium]